MSDLNNPPGIMGANAEWGYPGKVAVHDKAKWQESSGPAQPENAQMVDTLGLADKHLEGQEFTTADLPR